MTKISYKVRNWSEYNTALKKRGDLTIWIDEESTESWYADNSNGSKKGAPFTYSDIAITCGLSVRSVFNLPLRQTEGFLASILRLMGLEIKAPNYTTLCRRAACNETELPTSGNAVHIVIDSTGLKIYGEGEWKTRQYGYSKRRTWRKLHLAIDSESHQIIGSVITTNDIHDSEVFDDLISEDEYQAQTVSADGAYDAKGVYKSIETLGAKALILPRRGSRVGQHGNSNSPPLQRDENIRGIRKYGRKGWKRRVGYHRRSLAETAMYRFKTVFGDNLRSREFHRQATEAFIKIRALNIMTMLGMPETEAVPV